MKGKKEYLLLIIVIVALCSYLFFRKTNQTHYQLPEVPKIEEKEITKIEIIKASSSSISINKKDNKWFIEPKHYPADTEPVNKMLNVICDLTLTALVSEAKNYQLFDLQDDKKITVKAYKDGTLKLEFEMGRPAPSWNHTFVKLAGNPNVYHARGNFRNDFDLTVERLWDKTVMSFDQDEIAEVEILKGNESLGLLKKKPAAEADKQETDKDKAPEATKEKPGPKWETDDGKKADTAILTAVLSALSNLRCEKYIEDQGKDKFTKPIYTIKLKGPKEYTLSIFEKTEKDAAVYPAISSESDYAFLLSGSQAERIMKDPYEAAKKE